MRYGTCNVVTQSQFRMPLIGNHLWRIRSHFLLIQIVDSGRWMSRDKRACQDTWRIGNNRTAKCHSRLGLSGERGKGKGVIDRQSHQSVVPLSGPLIPWTLSRLSISVPKYRIK